MKRNITIQLDEEVIQEAKVLAAKKGTSISGLVTQSIVSMTAAARRYEEARLRALAAFPDRDDSSAGEPSARTWTREDLYDRWK